MGVPPMRPAFAPVVIRQGETITDRSHGRLVTVPRQRPWMHKLWREGPREVKAPWNGGRRDDQGSTVLSGRRANAPPLVLIRTVADRQLVVALSDEARAFGIRVGLALTEARALYPKIIHADHDPAQDARGLEALARWLMRFTPVVALCNSGLFLDITGCQRVFEGTSNIVHGVVNSLRRMHVSAGVAVAPTPGAAWAMACFDECGRIVPSVDELPAALAPLPVAGLRLEDEDGNDGELLASLHHLGLETIGQVMTLPREALPARFGPRLLLRLDQALSRTPEVLVPLAHHIPIQAHIEFDGAVESLEVLWIALRQLLRECSADLVKRGCGAREIKATFRRAYATPIDKTVRLSRPSRNVVEMFRLLECALEHVETDVGFTGITLHISVFERLTEEQISLMRQDESAGQIELDRLIERLIARLGERAIGCPKLVESHLPERAWTESDMGIVTVDLPLRPLQLLSTPVEVKVMVAPSNDRDGRPILFRRGGDVHELKHTVGPERISGEWWRGHDKTRDYFDVEDKLGKRFWLFRVNETGKWFLHGLF